MKSKKGLIGLIVIVAVLVLGIGYAVISNVSLTVSGSASAAERDLDVVISAASPNDSTADTYGTVNSPANKSATFTANNLTRTTDTRTVTYTVTNNDEVTAYVYIADASAIENSNSTYFDVSTSILGTTSGNVLTIASGQTATFTVSTHLTSVPVDAQSTTITVTLTATATNPAS